MAETFGTTQLRTVRVLRSHINSLWVYEEDVPWLVSYVASELVTGGVAPIIDPDGSIDDENSQGVPQDGAAVAQLSKGCTAVAELSKGCIMKPIKPMMNFYQLLGISRVPGNPTFCEARERQRTLHAESTI